MEITHVMRKIFAVCDESAHISLLKPGAVFYRMSLLDVGSVLLDEAIETLAVVQSYNIGALRRFGFIDDNLAKSLPDENYGIEYIREIFDNFFYEEGDRIQYFENLFDKRIITFLSAEQMQKVQQDPRNLESFGHSLDTVSEIYEMNVHFEVCNLFVDVRFVDGRRTKVVNIKVMTFSEAMGMDVDNSHKPNASMEVCEEEQQGTTVGDNIPAPESKLEESEGKKPLIPVDEAARAVTVGMSLGSTS